MKVYLMLIFSILTMSGIAQTTTTVTSMSDADFKQFLQNISSEDLRTLTPESMESIKDRFTASRTYFSTDQVRKMLTAVEKDSGKLALARLLYDKVSDPGNFARLSDLFNSETYQREFVIWANKQDKS